MLFQVFQSKVNNSHQRGAGWSYFKVCVFKMFIILLIICPLRSAGCRQHIETILSCEVQWDPVTLNSSMYSFVLWFLLESVLDKRHFVLCSNIWVSHCEIEDQKASIKGSFFFISYIIPVFVLLVNRIPTDYRKATWLRLATSFFCGN